MDFYTFVEENTILVEYSEITDTLELFNFYFNKFIKYKNNEIRNNLKDKNILDLHIENYTSKNQDEYTTYINIYFKTTYLLNNKEKVDKLNYSINFSIFEQNFYYLLK